MRLYVLGFKMRLVRQNSTWPMRFFALLRNLELFLWERGSLRPFRCWENMSKFSSCVITLPCIGWWAERGSLWPPVSKLVQWPLLLLNIIINLYLCKGRLPRWLSGKGSACQCRRCGFDPWVGKILCRGKWQPVPVFLLGKSQRQKSLAVYSPWGSKESDTT